MKIWANFIKPAVILSIICAVTSGLLALTNNVTAPIIEENKIRIANEARSELLSAPGFEQIDATYENVLEIYKASDDSGYVITATAGGYAGDVPVMVALADGKVLGVTFLANSETPGLGQKVRDDSFKQQFSDIEATQLTLDDVDVIAGATITTNAAIAAVNSALLAYLDLEGVDTGLDLSALSEEEVHNYVLPDSGALSEISLSGADKAYKGENYGVIIYASMPGFYAKPLTAVVGFDDNGIVTGVWFNTENETESYGGQVGKNADFSSQFIGERKEQYDIIASATTSSNAAIAAVYSAFDIYEENIESLKEGQ